MKYRLISKEEWFYVRVSRGCEMTGYVHMTVSTLHTKNPELVGLTYFWKYGMQPSVPELKRIADKNPINAAKKFLEFYEPRGDKLDFENVKRK